VKFAKYIPATDENEKVLELVALFVKETKEQQIAQNNND